MRFFDLHSDTPFRMYRENLDSQSCELDCSPCALGSFETAAAVYAVWSDSKNCGQRNYEDFFRIKQNLLSDIAVNCPQCRICTYKDELCSDEKVKLILAVEGGNLLCGDALRLSVLYDCGVRVFTPLWRGCDDIGGAYGLTEFGKSVITECERLGIIPDVSHMSQKSFYDTLEVAESPVIASHSNSYSLCGSSRNLTDGQITDLIRCGGLVGVNLYPPFVTAEYENMTKKGLFDALCGHIIHMLSLGGKKSVCLGGDRDGFERVEGYSQVCFANEIYRGLIHRGVNENIIKDIFYGNAERFFKKRMPQNKR